MINFKDITYLKEGTVRQKEAYKTLLEQDVFDYLKKYNPILVGTIPIDINVDSSDLDIVFQCENHQEFILVVTQKYGNHSGFEVEVIPSYKELETTIIRFEFDNFPIEFFVQNKHPEKQDSYLHMLVEYQVLLEERTEFKSKIIALKQQGIKTEPAFAQLLGLEGDPYQGLLNYGYEKGYIS